MDAPTSPLWIVIPAYRAQAHVADVVRAAAAHGLPVLVVDDGSDDATATAAADAGAVVLRHAQNRGKGAALQTGFAHALLHGAPAVLTMDADGQHDTDEIPQMLAAHRLAPQALIMGVRSFDPQLMPRRSRIGNTISTFFISRFAGRPHRDTQSGFRIYPGELLRAAPLRTRRFDTETELLLWASKLGVALREVPIQTIYHGAAHVTHFRTLTDTLRVIRLVVGSLSWRTEPVDRPIPYDQMEAT